MPTLMHRPGPCIQLTKKTSYDYFPGTSIRDANGYATFVLPMDQDFAITTSQELQEPIKELFSHLQEAVIGVSGDLGGATGSAVSRAILEISNATGFQLGSKGYHSKAWKGALPLLRLS